MAERSKYGNLWCEHYNHPVGIESSDDYLYCLTMWVNVFLCVCVSIYVHICIYIHVYSKWLSGYCCPVINPHQIRETRTNWLINSKVLCTVSRDRMRVSSRIAIETITAEMLQIVWNELDYFVDIFRITKGATYEKKMKCCSIK